MRVVFPFTDPHPLALAALEEHIPSAERVQIDPYRSGHGDRPGHYHDLLCELWTAGESFLVVEHDIEVHADVVPQLESCEYDWCIFPYGGPGYTGYSIGDGADHLLKRSLGCTRFSERLLREQPEFMNRLPVRNWQRLDCEIYPRLEQLEYTPHEHYPIVAHHHVYNGACACGGSHEDLP